jgi:hypothetical protein
MHGRAPRGRSSAGSGHFLPLTRHWGRKPCNGWASGSQSPPGTLQGAAGSGAVLVSTLEGLPHEHVWAPCMHTCSHITCFLSGMHMVFVAMRLCLLVYCKHAAAPSPLHWLFLEEPLAAVVVPLGHCAHLLSR